jgi:hypothetical protein
VLIRLRGEFPGGQAWEIIPPEQINLE